jgi:glycosyltransferase involved in cell wall biosynthesis
MEKKPKILIDASPVVNEFRNRGVGNQAVSLIRELLKDERYEWQLFAPGTKTELVKALGYTAEFELPHEFEFFQLTGNNLIARLSASLYFRLYVTRVIRQARADCVLYFQIDRGVASFLPSIVFVPDIIPLQTGSYSQKSPLVNFIKGKSYKWLLEKAKNATRVLTLSSYSKDRLIEVGFTPEKIDIVPLALSSQYEQAVAKQEAAEDQLQLKRRIFNSYNLTEPYICYFGGLEENKNVGQVLAAFAKLSDRYPDLKLVIGGGEFKLGWDHKATPLNERAAMLYELAKELKIAHKMILTGFVETAHQPVIYKYAKAFIHLSKIEGFGLTVLEPQAVGTPVIGSNSSTYPEILGDSAILVAPDDTESIAAQIERVISDDEASEKLRAQLATAGKENLKRFSWSSSAQLTLKTVASVLAERKSNRQGDEIAVAKTSDIADTPAKSVKNTQKPELQVKSESQAKPGLQVKPESPEKPKAVVLACYYWPFRGGMEQVAGDYAQFLSENGYEVHVITSDRKEGNIVINKEETYDGVHIHRLTRQGKNYYFHRLRGLLKLLKEIKPSFIHQHGLGFFFYDLVVLRYKRWAAGKLTQVTSLNSAVESKQPLVIVNTPHGPFMSKAETGLRSVFKTIMTRVFAVYVPNLYDGVFAVNHEQHRWMQKYYNIPLNKIFLHPPVCPPAPAAKQADQLIEQKAGKDHILICCISRFADYKGFDDIVAAFEQINSATPTKLYLAGADSDYRKTLETIVASSPRKQDITIEVNISDEQRDLMLKAADIFVFASSWEAFGIVLAEAMAAGNAIISSNTEGGRFMVKPGENGDLFSYKDLKALISLLDSLLQDKGKLKKYQKAGITMLENMSRDKLKTRFIATIQKLYSKFEINSVN